MNISLVDLGDTKGLSIDENGDVTVISKEKNDASFDEILQKENELEAKECCMTKASDKYNYTKGNLRASRFCNVFIVAGMIVVSIFLYGTPIKAILLANLALGGLGKFMSIGSFGTTSGNRRRIRRLKNEIAKLENEIPAVEKELKDMKNKANYNVISHFEFNNQEVSLNNTNSQDEVQNGKRRDKVRIRRLVKDSKTCNMCGERRF